MLGLWTSLGQVWLDYKLCLFYHPWGDLKNVLAAYVGDNEAPEINDPGGWEQWPLKAIQLQDAIHGS